MTLKEENEILKKQLQHAQEWMKREIWEKKQNLEHHIQEKIYSFFSPGALSYFPSDGIENITSSEIIFEHILAGEALDGMGVIIGYQKVIDEMVELYITKWFRKYCEKNLPHIAPQNIPLEKSLHSVIYQKYILSLWRLYNILQLIQKQEVDSFYTQGFVSYIESRQYLKNSLLDTHFFLLLERLIRLHAITDKRHSWTLSKRDTIEARNIVIGDFHDTNCILSLLADSQNISL